MNQIDKRILHMIEIMKESGVIRFYADFHKAAGMSKQHFNLIKTGKNHFTAEHIGKIIKAFGVNANWIFGMSEELYLNTNKKQIKNESISRISKGQN